MDIKNKNKHKKKFKDSLVLFANKLEKYVSTENGDWSVKGFIDVYKNIFTISSDTKIVSKILEIHIFPQILQFAEENGFNVVLTEHQNYYPDLTFISKKYDEVKFAVDLKTTYRKKNGISSFTLGSHGSYFKERDKKKNIQYPYNQYLGHYCLGVIYTRVDVSDDFSETEIFKVQELEQEYNYSKKVSGVRKVTTVENLLDWSNSTPVE